MDEHTPSKEGNHMTKDNNGIGHNAASDAQDRAALQQFYAIKIRQAQRIAASAKAEYDEAREQVSSLYTLVKADLHITRKEMQELIALANMTEREYIAHERGRRSRMVDAGLPVQGDLFDRVGDLGDDQEAEANGYRAGRRGEEPKPPAEIAGTLQTIWMEGWHRGQKENADQFLRAQEVLDRRANPNVDAEKVGLNEDDGTAE